MSPAPDATPGRDSSFAPRPVAFQLGGQLLRETSAILAAAPGRLLGLYLLIYLPVQLLSGPAYLAMPLRASLASVGFAGFYCALEAARLGRAPGLRDLAGPWRLPRDKLVLLCLGGLVPVLLVWLAWWIDLGSLELGKLLANSLADGGADSARDNLSTVASVSNPALGQKIEAVLIENLADIPLLLLQPMCVLFSWSATRTFSANLMVSLANWHWGLFLAAALTPIGLSLYSYHPGTLSGDLLLLIADVAVGIFLNAFCLVLLHHSLD